MIAKLLKHDLLQTKKQYIIMFITAFAFFLLAPILTWLQILSSNGDSIFSNILLTLLLVTSIFLFFGISIGVIITGYRHLHDSLFTKQGYLAFTLPFKTWQIVLSKILTILVWGACYSIVITAGTAIMYGESLLILSKYIPIEEIHGFLSMFQELGHSIIEAMTHYDSSTAFWSSFVSILNTIIALPLSIILFLLGESLAHTNIFKSNKKGLGVLIFIALSFVVNYIIQFIVSILAANEGVSILVPLVIQFIIELGVVIGGYELIIYLLEYRLELV